MSTNREARGSQPPAAVVVIVTSADGKHSTEVEVEGVTPENYSALVDRLNERLDEGLRHYQVIADSFIDALEACPDANPSDLWRYVVYLPYRRYRSDQSWKRASGQGLEVAFCGFYNSHLEPHGIRIVRLTRSAVAFREMGIVDRVGQSKLDAALLGRCKDRSWRIFGGIHIKGSIAERISDDAPASVEMQKAGYFSPFVTLDMKAFPPPRGAEVNRGELQLPQRGGESDKRNYFERDGLFSACYSYNIRTPPTPEGEDVAARIEVLRFSDPKPDVFMRDVIGAWEARADRLCQDLPPSEVVG